jgi:hypothetical protein
MGAGHLRRQRTRIVIASLNGSDREAVQLRIADAERRVISLTGGRAANSGGCCWKISGLTLVCCKAPVSLLRDDHRRVHLTAGLDDSLTIDRTMICSVRAPAALA